MMSDEVLGNWPLTEAQIQCLRGVWQLKSAKQIAVELSISHHAVEKRLLAARQQLGVSSSADAARLLFEGTKDVTVGPYYQASEVQSDGLLDQKIGPQASHIALSTGTGGQARINNLGTGQTMLAIVLVAIGAILAVAALIAAGQGVNQLWKAIGH